MVKISRRLDEGKSTKKSFKYLRYGPRKTVSNHLKQQLVEFWLIETVYDTDPQTIDTKQSNILKTLNEIRFLGGSCLNLL